MRLPLLLSLGALVASASALTRAPLAAAPCTTATAACEQWITLGGGPARSMVYSSYPLSKPNATVTRALIMVHGTNRNADHYFETALSAAFLAGALENTVVISPHIIAAPDTPEANEVLWPNRGDTWRSGGMSPSNPTLSAFDFMDEIVRTLANKKMFPNLRNVVVAGHSAGGQFVTRYEMANKVHGSITALGSTVTYVVANPSSYGWPAGVRPLARGDADPATADKEALGPDGEKLHAQFTYGPFDATKVATFDQWPSGLENRSGYTAQMSDDQLRKNLVERPTTYLFGQDDDMHLGGYYSSHTAMAQGPTRRSRGEAFVKYITETLGAKPNVMIVPECGHNDRCIFTTDIVFPAIFPK